MTYHRPKIISNHNYTLNTLANHLWLHCLINYNHWVPLFAENNIKFYQCHQLITVKICLRLPPFPLHFLLLLSFQNVEYAKRRER